MGGLTLVSTPLACPDLHFNVWHAVAVVLVACVGPVILGLTLYCVRAHGMQANVTVVSDRNRPFMLLKCSKGFIGGGVRGDVTVRLTGNATAAGVCTAPTPAAGALRVRCVAGY